MGIDMENLYEKIIERSTLTRYDASTLYSSCNIIYRYTSVYIVMQEKDDSSKLIDLHSNER